jgi:hypothetical protein
LFFAFYLSHVSDLEMIILRGNHFVKKLIPLIGVRFVPHIISTIKSLKNKASEVV